MTVLKEALYIVYIVHRILKEKEKCTLSWRTLLARDNKNKWVKRQRGPLLQLTMMQQSSDSVAAV